MRLPRVFDLVEAIEDEDLTQLEKLVMQLPEQSPVFESGLPVVTAIEMGNLTALTICLDAGLPASVDGDGGEQAMNACSSLDPDLRASMCAMLTTRGLIDGRRLDHLLYLSLLNDDAIVASTLLSAGADAKDVRDKDGVGLLHLARTPELVGALLSAGAPVDVTDPNGNTPLRNALIQVGPDSVVEVVSQLIAAGATVDKPDNYGETPLYLALWCASPAVGVLLDAGASVGIVQRDGRTMMHACCGGPESSRVPLAERLHALGVGVSGADVDGITPLQIARQNGNVALVKWLTSHGA